MPTLFRCFRQDSPSTWEDAGKLVEHIKAASKHAAKWNVLPELCAQLLTDAGVYISVALSGFSEVRVDFFFHVHISFFYLIPNDAGY